MEQDEINAMLASLDGDSTEDKKDESLDDEIAKIVDDVNDTIDEEVSESEPEVDSTEQELHDSKEKWLESKIEVSELPYPTQPEHKVVSQLSKVTQEGEEKASEIFDAILSSTDRLANIDSKLEDISNRCDSLSKFMVALHTKFPNLSIVEKQKDDISSMIADLDAIKEESSNSTQDLYKAMETMQYQDISRQKIERVITVVRKLSDYLNNVFDIDESTKDIKVAKHIEGDEGNDLVSIDDIDDLIKDFDN